MEDSGEEDGSRMVRTGKSIARDVEKRVTDVLVVGSGGAGLRAAIEAARAGCKTVVISKGKVNRSGASLLAGANVSADIECDGNSLYKMGFPDAGRDDSKDAWFLEIVDQGMFLNNQKLVESYVDTAPNRVGELIDWGLKVHGLESERGISVSSRELLDVLVRKAVELGVGHANDLQAVDLLLKDGRVGGILAVDVLKGEYIVYEAKAVILATGGWHSLYPFTSGSTDLTGDGQAMAFRAGAELINMEMVTFCPNTVVAPRTYRGSIVPYVLGATGYGHLLNRKGEEFLDRYFDAGLLDLALHTEWNKLLLSFAEAEEIRRDGTRNGGLYFSMKHCPNEVFDDMLDTIPGLKEFYAPLIERLKNGYSIEVAPAPEYFEGGIRINERCETTIPGLYAAGECTGGTFGANRVSAATTQMLVQGYVAAKSAVEFVKQAGGVEVDWSQVGTLVHLLDYPLSQGHSSSGVSPVSLRKEVSTVASRYMSLLRTGEGLACAAEEVRRIRDKLTDGVSLSSDSRLYNLEWLDYLTVRNLVDVLEASVTSALVREESRGVHFREDHPYTDNDDWLKCIVTAKSTKASGGNVAVRFEPVTVTRVKPPTGRMSYQEFIRSLARKYI